MRFDDVAIPLGSPWATPFVRWQGSLAGTHALDLAVEGTVSALRRSAVPPSQLTGIVLGTTVPQIESFYGGPTVAARIGAPSVSGPIISQACATSVAALHHAALVAQRSDEVIAVITADRTSNGPLITYPAPEASGGAPLVEHWVLDNFRRDPWAGGAMIATAETVAADLGVDRSELEAIALLRHEQYRAALRDDRAFQAPWMVPVTVPARRGAPVVVDRDAGVHATTAEGLAALRTSVPDGVMTAGTQTHPADGAAGMLVAALQASESLAAGRGVARVLSTAFARAGRGRMPEAPVPAARQALADADIGMRDLHAVKTHSPFAVNDVCLSRGLGIDLESMNAYGCSLVYGHPQAPTGARGIVELIAELELRGGGIGLFVGCAAGDTAAAVVVEVSASKTKARVGRRHLRNAC